VEVLQAVVDRPTEVLRAAAGALWLVDDEQRSLTLARSVGYSEGERAALARFPLSAAGGSPLLSALKNGRLWLLILTLWSTASGLIGVYLQKHIPGVLAHALSVEAIYERIPELVDQLQAEAATTMTGASDVLQRFYDAQVQPALAGLSPSWSYVLDAHRGRDERLAQFEHLRSFVGDDDKQRLADLRAIVAEKLELEAHYSLQRALRLWPFLHVPPAALLLAAILVHVAAVWYF